MNVPSSSRLPEAIKNALVSGAVQVFMIITRFIIQTVFVHKLGKVYTGVNGLFNNIILILNLAELGIGGAITFSLYKALALKNYSKIAGLMNFYRKVYHAIALLITIFGLIIMVFLPVLIKDKSVPHITIIYLLFLLNTVLSYFFSFKRALLTADQKDYLNQINIFIFTFIQITIQLYILLVYQNYIAYLIIFIVLQIISNLFISRKVDCLYPFLKTYKNKRISKDERRNIERNTKELVGNKLSDVVIMGTDNVLLSAFLGVTTVGIYSNYELIKNAANKLFQLIIAGTTASVGNFVHLTTDRKQVEKLFFHHAGISFLMSLTSFVFLLNLMPPLITLWVGKNYLVGSFTIWLINFNLSLQIMRNTPQAFFQALGTYQYVGVKSVVETIFNLLLSLLLLKFTNLKIAAVVLGTLLANISMNSWWEPYQIYRLYFKKSVKKFLFLYYSRLILLIFTGSSAQFFINLITFERLWPKIGGTVIISGALILLVAILFVRTEVRMIIKFCAAKFNLKKNK